MSDNPPHGFSEFQQAAEVSGTWSRYWMQQLADATTIVGESETRFTPGVLAALHRELLTFDSDALKLLLVASLINGAALLHDDLRR